MPNLSENLLDQSLRCGILIVGSLLWNEDADGYRALWRKKRLDLSAKQHVQAPLRYGRKSQSWGGTFTMILDADASHGQAVLVPCMAPIQTFDDMFAEVKWLWAAEANKSISESFHSSWGCIGAHFGPKAVAKGLAEHWNIHFQSAKPASFSAINSDGRLNVPWPSTLSGHPVEHFDVILATATMPKPRDARPDAGQIAKGWLDQNERHERYFFENIRHGIRTHDDHEIWKMIDGESPKWLYSDDYKAAIEILRSEMAL